MRHVALDLDVRFEDRRLEGTVELSIERRSPGATRLDLDTRALSIEAVDARGSRRAYRSVPYRVDEPFGILGSRLSVDLPSGADRVRVRYATQPDATALQWTAARQTAGREFPFLFTQSQAIHARSWIPLQDSPAVRQTYSATVRVPRGLTALMSAARTQRSGETTTRFAMAEPIPSYLIALAVGDLAFASLGARCGVWAERPVLARAAGEFVDTEAMVAAAETLFGPYRWGRYDLLVLPPSFPYGGMENPRLTFATPTLLAGDRSLVSVIAHEIAHSWSGNLVTNGEWSDFWLNEGFTTYCERRIVERIFGLDSAEMSWALGRDALDDLLGRLPPEDGRLRLPLEGRDPDQDLTEVAYEKGALLLRTIEERVGRPGFDRFLRRWFDRNAFASVASSDFVRAIEESFPGMAGVGEADLAEWLHEPGIPDAAARVRARSFDRIDDARTDWLAGRLPTGQLPAGAWTTPEWLRFLKGLPRDLSAAKRRDVDSTFAISGRENAEIAFEWLLLAIRAGDAASVAAPLEGFLFSTGRRKFVKPLYEELARTLEGRALAIGIYERARPGYHPITRETVDTIVGWQPSNPLPRT